MKILANLLQIILVSQAMLQRYNSCTIYEVLWLPLELVLLLVFICLKMRVHLLCIEHYVPVYRLLRTQEMRMPRNTFLREK